MAKLVCTLEMSKERGVTITVVNADDGITQTVTLDGTSLTLKVVGKSDQSSLTQTAEAIRIACKDFEVVASNSIVGTAANTIDLESTKGDTTMTSGANWVQSAIDDSKISATNVKVEASSAATIGGATAGLSATQSLSLTGTAEATMSGGSVTVSADGTMSLKSTGTATLEGSMTTIKGSLIKAG